VVVRSPVAELPKNRGRNPEVEVVFGGHIFDRVCRRYGIDHEPTRQYHPWTNGQADRTDRMTEDATT
jgi:transposase InsO family protein